VWQSHIERGGFKEKMAFTLKSFSDFEFSVLIKNHPLDNFFISIIRLEFFPLPQ
jgi:hypothetical protein